MAQQTQVGQGLLIVEDSWSHSHTHTHTHTPHSVGVSERVISSSQRPLPDNTEHSQQTSMPPAEFEHKIPAGERRQTHASERAAAGIGK